MPVSFLASTSTLKVAPHGWPDSSAHGTAFNSLSGCSKLLKPPEVVKKHPVKKINRTTQQHYYSCSLGFCTGNTEMNKRARKWSLNSHLNVGREQEDIKNGNNSKCQCNYLEAAKRTSNHALQLQTDPKPYTIMFLLDFRRFGKVITSSWKRKMISLSGKDFVQPYMEDNRSRLCQSIVPPQLISSALELKATIITRCNITNLKPRHLQAV